jgi:hypothetical protein
VVNEPECCGKGAGAAAPALLVRLGRAMDELLSEFLTETGEGLDQLDIEFVCFEREPNNAETLNTIFRLVQPSKELAAFLGSPGSPSSPVRPRL